MSQKNIKTDLIGQINELQAENSELLKRLNSKRYKLIDKAVNTTYRIIRPKFLRKVNKPTTLPPTPTRKTVRPINSPRKIDHKRIDIINVNFYDWTGTTVYRGGAERYVYDLACLLKQLGYNPRILQGAHEPFEKMFHGIHVIGVKMKNQNMRTMSLTYNKICTNAELIIASPLELASEISCGAPVISINHGVNFDHISNKFNLTVNQNYLDYINALEASNRCVCVDTNFINWVRTRDYKLSMKTLYIPNYYDADLFTQSEIKRHNDRVVFVYPRRIYSARGYDITLHAFRRLFKKYPGEIELRLIGQIDNDKAKKDVTQMIADFPNAVSQTSYSTDDMPKAYSDADVVIIPTRYSEGTSLSCIEGLASETAIIATNIGGLPNIIIDNFNGLLISPTAQDIEEAASRLIENPELRTRLAKNGKKVAQAAFQKDLWDEKWSNIIKAVINGNNN